MLPYLTATPVLHRPQWLFTVCSFLGLADLGPCSSTASTCPVSSPTPLMLPLPCPLQTLGHTGVLPPRHPDMPGHPGALCSSHLSAFLPLFPLPGITLAWVTPLHW